MSDRGQVDVDPAVVCDDAGRAPMRFENFDAIRAALCIYGFAEERFREMSTGLAPAS